MTEMWLAYLANDSQSLNVVKDVFEVSQSYVRACIVTEAFAPMANGPQSISEQSYMLIMVLSEPKNVFKIL